MYEAERKKQEAGYEALLRMNGPENPYRLHLELSDWMVENVTVVRYNDRLRKTDEKLQELLERWRRIGVDDSSSWCNKTVSFTRQLYNMLHLARAITLGALARDESRGAHYKPEFPDRDDANWLKTTIAGFTEDGPRFAYKDVDLAYIKPRPRRYDVVKEAQQPAEPRHKEESAR